MRTYYRGPDAVVTSELFVWRTAPPKVFVIRELKQVGIVCVVVDRARPTSARVAAGPAVLTMSVWPVVDTPLLIITVVLAVALPAAAAVAYWRMRPRRWEMHAHYRGTEVLLYASTDARVFNQVARALRRAREDADPHSSWDGDAAA
jgi:hypothetical protein